jgi:hypothetical protein
VHRNMHKFANVIRKLKGIHALCTPENTGIGAESGVFSSRLTVFFNRKSGVHKLSHDHDIHRIGDVSTSKHSG